MSNWGTFKYKGMPIVPGDTPCFGDVYFVTNATGVGASDGNTGLSPNKPKATIQGAITAQIANTQGFGDRIYIMPGTYPETIYASALNLVELIGYSADSVIVAPTDDHALLVGVDAAGGTAAGPTMTNSIIRNMTFLTPSTSNTTYAALCVGYTTKSVIEDCKFKGTTATGTGASATTGLRIGNETDSPWEFHEHSRISRCVFSSNGGRTTQCGVGIHVGANSVANPEYKGFKSMIIEDCLITAKDRGIRLGTGAASCAGTVICRNHISAQEAGGVGVGIQSMATDGEDLLCSVHDNRIIAINDGILNFSTGNVQGNIVALNYSGTPAAETA